MMTPLDPFHIDLEKTTLIEASAGTGKTYTITTLYCRLVALGYSVESILVVTFTEAAAAELKLRVRTRLVETLDRLEDASCDRDDELADFFRRDRDLDLICQRLKLGLTCFDQAAIMTIHSFCLKVLKENAFESHSFFDIELVPDRSVFLQQVSYDFFMARVNNLDPLFLAYLGQQQITPESFAAAFGSVVSRADLAIKPGDVHFDDAFDAGRKVMARLEELLLSCSGEIKELIRSHPGIDKRSYTQKNVPAWLEASSLKFQTSGANPVFKMTEKGDALYKFTRTRLAQKTKPGHLPPDHEFFDVCEQLLDLYQGFEQNLICLEIEFLSFFTAELEKMKTAQGVCFFDDLVNDLAAALEKEDGQALQKAVRQTYGACLIDEFQDTDPRQYDIFSQIFFSPGTPFFMIGDPKQAIYAFRGGDIFAYLNASKACDQQYTLEKNYRSAPLLVQAINQIFSSRKNPFKYTAIEFPMVKTPSSAKNILVKNQKPVPPVQFCFIRRRDQQLDRQNFFSKETAAKIIPAAVAADILSLLQSENRLLDKSDPPIPQPITPADIAVLVRTNLQAEQVQNALSDLNIPSFLSKTGSVFDSVQAIDLQDILRAVYSPDNKGAVNAALCTGVFNFTAADLLAQDLCDDLVLKWQDRFRSYRQTWETKGFVSMIMRLFHSRDAFLKPGSGLDERSLTNFYHLVELISQACLRQQLSPYFLMKWYARQRVKDLRDEMADELRLESDKKAVAIVTVHKSKGLEYPVVYLPYLWEGLRRPATRNILFHDPQKNHALTLDLGSADLEGSMQYFQTEEQAEQRRLLYVALTRAAAMCRIIWGGFKSVETSALGSLLHDHDCKDDRSMISDLETLKGLSDKAMAVHLHSSGMPGLFTAGEKPDPPVLSAGNLVREVRAVWKMSSFSAVIHTARPKSFQTPEPVEETSDGKIITLANFPKGPGSGDFFHSVFEHLDFTQGMAGINDIIVSMSGQSGFSDPRLQHMAGQAVKQVVDTPLAPGKHGFCLKDIHLDQRLNEMEFTFPVHSFQMASIQKAFESSPSKIFPPGYLASLSQFSAPAFQGFMKGFIDLVVQHKGKWYILDYKSNYLGDTYAHYSQDAIVSAMADHHYFLQYYFYLVALHRYLGLRLKHYSYDLHFGGVFYLFIRGMHPDTGPGCGVFFDRPAKSCICCLSDNL